MREVEEFVNGAEVNQRQWLVGYDQRYHDDIKEENKLKVVMWYKHVYAM